MNQFFDSLKKNINCSLAAVIWLQIVDI